MREPASEDPLMVELLLSEEGGGPWKLEPQSQPWGQLLAAQTLQTSVVPMETVPPTQTVEPIPRAVGSGPGRLALVGAGEACPLLAGHGPWRNSVLFLPVHPEDAPAHSTPTSSPTRPRSGREGSLMAHCSHSSSRAQAAGPRTCSHHMGRSSGSLCSLTRATSPGHPHSCLTRQGRQRGKRSSRWPLRAWRAYGASSYSSSSRSFSRTLAWGSLRT